MGVVDVQGNNRTTDKPKENHHHGSLKRNYDIVATISTGAVFLALDATVGIPWPLWAAYGVLVAAQLGNRVIRGWSR